MVDQPLDKITVAAVSKLRDGYIKAGLSPSTIQKRLALLGHLYTIAISEWHIPLTNPVKSVRKPVIDNQRTRRVSDGELKAVLDASESKALKYLAPLALDTGARLGELVAIKTRDIDEKKSLLTFPLTKNGEVRTIPVQQRVIRLLSQLSQKQDGRLFDVTAEAMSRAWARAVARARKDYEAQGGDSDEWLVNLHFHDLRHERISRLAEVGLGTLELSAISGHKSLSMLKRYTHISPEFLGAKLAQLEA